MNLTAFHLANFKAFAATQRIPLRPITLIYGPNSAGKSSILHALTLSHHAIETGNLDTQRTEIGGDAVDLGGFRQYVHRRDRDRNVVLGFEVDPGRLSGRTASLLRSARQIRVELAIGESIVSSQQNKDPNDTRVGVERFAVDVNGTPLLSMSARAGGVLRLDRLDHSHPVFRELLRGILMLATTTREIRNEDFVVLGKEIDALVPEIVAKRRGLFPRVDEDVESHNSSDEMSYDFVPISRGHRQEDLASASRLFVPRVLRNLVGGLGSTIEDDIRRLSYLGPLRSYPPRHLAFSQHHDSNWFAGGGYAWDVVRKNRDVRRRVNSWLGNAERLQTPYQLVVRELLPSDLVAAELPSRLNSQFHDLLVLILAELAQGDLFADGELFNVQFLSEDFVDRLELARKMDLPYAEISDLGPFPEIEELVSAQVDSDALSQHWAQVMVDSRPDLLQDLVLVDLRTNTPVSHRDVGIGVSQILPILVAAYASRNKLLAIEQPEIHLHPALQAELGDVLLESALGDSGNIFLIETHSEHLLLRIMRRMRETNTSKLPVGVPQVGPEDVIVLFVEPDGPRSIIREMPLNERGELVKAWPGGFFEEGLREIF